MHGRCPCFRRQGTFSERSGGWRGGTPSDTATRFQIPRSTTRSGPPTPAGRPGGPSPPRHMPFDRLRMRGLVLLLMMALGSVGCQVSERRVVERQLASLAPDATRKDLHAAVPPMEPPEMLPLVGVSSGAIGGESYPVSERLEIAYMVHYPQPARRAATIASGRIPPAREVGEIGPSASDRVFGMEVRRRESSARSDGEPVRAGDRIKWRRPAGKARTFTTFG